MRRIHCFGIIILSSIILLLSSCNKCKECTVTFTSEYLYNESYGLTVQQWEETYPDVTNTEDLSTICDDQLEQIDGKTLTTTVPQASDSTEIFTTSVYECL